MIVIGYDGSPDARAAIEQAAVLLPGHPALVLAVWAPSVPGDVAEPVAPVAPARVAAESLAGDGARIGHEFGIDCQPRTREQNITVAEVIRAEARLVDARAIVLGRGGRSGDASLGSVTSAVLREAGCAVLVAAKGEAQPAVSRAEHRAEVTA